MYSKEQMLFKLGTVTSFSLYAVHISPLLEVSIVCSDIHW